MCIGYYQIASGTSASKQNRRIARSTRKIEIKVLIDCARSNGIPVVCFQYSFCLFYVTCAVPNATIIVYFSTRFLCYTHLYFYVAIECETNEQNEEREREKFGAAARQRILLRLQQ